MYPSRFIFCVATSALLLAARTDGQDRSDRKPADAWLMFGGSPGRTVASQTAKNLPTEWSGDPEDEKNVRWKAKIGTLSFSAPVVAQGRVYVGTNNQNPRDRSLVHRDGRPIDAGVLMCFRESDGKLLWQIAHAKLETGRENDWPLEGLRSTPAIEGDRLYYVTNRCELICALAESGNAIWKLDMRQRLGVFPFQRNVSSPLIVGDLVFVVTANGVDGSQANIPSPNAPSFIAVDKRTGEFRWSNNEPTIQFPAVQALVRKGIEPYAAFRMIANQGRIIQRGQWGSPAYTPIGEGGQVIFPGGDGWLRAFEPKTGKLLWRFDCNPQGAKVRNHFHAAPTIDGHFLYIGVGEDPEHEADVGHLWCVDLAKALAFGRRIPGGDVSPKNNNFDPRAVVNATSALAWHYGGTFPVADRAKEGRKDRFGRTLSTAAVQGGFVYAADLGGFLHCLDRNTGEALWTHNLNAYCWSSPVIADGKVFIGNDAGDVNVFAHSPKKRLLAINSMPG